MLEIGGDALFARAAPEQTTFHWCAERPSPERWPPLGPWRLIRRLIDLRAGKYDLLVVHARQYSPWHLRSLLTAARDWNVRLPLGLFTLFAWRFLLGFHDTPIAAIDLDDGFGLGRHNFALLKRCQLFFKRELPTDHWQVFYKTGHRNLPSARWRSNAARRAWIGKLRPISYGSFTPLEVSMDAHAAGKKTSDIFFAGRIEPNSSVRLAGLPELERLAGEGYVVDIPTAPLPLPEFLRRLSAAWLAWSPEGMGWDCGRHYEAALMGTVPLINYPTIARHEPLIDRVHCILYGVEPGGLAAAARAALADKPRLARMAIAAREHVRERHSCRARADYVAMAVCGRSLDGRPAPGEDEEPFEDVSVAAGAR